MIHKPFDDITKADIDALKINEVSEGTTLEYKETLPDNSSDGRKEFLADVSSFANASGGDILYGIRGQRNADGKSNGLPEEAIGLADFNPDADLLRLENMLRDSIEPRLPVVQMKAIDGFPNGPVLLIRVGQSWNAPHRSKRDAHFYSRTSAGKYQMEVSQIRSAFVLSQTLAEQVRRFRDERLARVIADETPIPLTNKVRLVVHVVPALAVQGDRPVDIYELVQDEQRRQELRPMHAMSWSTRYNFDGFVTYTDNSYLQLFNTGALEWVDANLSGEIDNNTRVLAGDLIVRDLYKCFETAKTVLADLEISSVAFCLVTFLGVKGHYLATGGMWRTRSRPIDRDTLIFPDVRIDDYQVNTTGLLLPILDVLWRAVGYAHWNHYS